jgi:DNA-directed RNA polymerase subunit RPC12/RpoP
MKTEQHSNSDKLVKYECAKCEEEITLNLKAVMYTKDVICPYCHPVDFVAVG